MGNIQHLLNLNEQRIIMLGGLPGAGKSTLAKQLIEIGYVIICPDTYRGIVSRTKPGREHWTNAEHEGDQSVSAEAWKMAYEESHKAIKNGKSIVFDAMLHTLKARRGTMGELKRHKVPFHAVYLDVTLETAKKRNTERGTAGGRTVPDFVLKSKWRQQVFPMIREGFKTVTYISNDLNIEPIDDDLRLSILQDIVNNPRETITKMYHNGVLEKIFPILKECWGFSQDNQHHNLPLHEHMITAAELIEDRSPVAVISALLHDVGKRKTKEFFAKVIKENDYFKVDEKLTLLKRTDIGATFEKLSWNGIQTTFLPYEEVEIDSDAHYYDHDNVGAIDARRNLLTIGFNEEFANKVYANILYHMELPYKEVSDKHLKTIIDKVGDSRIHTLFAIRKADKSAGSYKGEELDVYTTMIEQVNKILKKE